MCRMKGSNLLDPIERIRHNSTIPTQPISAELTTQSKLACSISSTQSNSTQPNPLDESNAIQQSQPNTFQLIPI